MLPAVLLALRVPAGNDRGPQYMDQALAAIHQGNPHRHPLTLVLGRHGESVTVFCQCPDALAATVESQLYAQYPDCKIDRVAEGVLDPAPGESCLALDLHLAPDLFPIKRFAQFEDALNRVTADPLTAILATVARDRSDKLRSLVAITLRPARAGHRRRAEKTLHRLARPFFRRHPRMAHFYAEAALSPAIPRRLLAFLLARIARPSEHDHHGDTALHTSATRLHDREDHLQAAADKIGRNLFETEIRLAVSGPESACASARAKLAEMAGAFGQFSVPSLAVFHSSRVRHARPGKTPHGKGFLLSTEEVATLFHPPTETVRSPTLASVESRELPPPLGVPLTSEHEDLAVLGTTNFRLRLQRFGILPDDRRRHVSIIGKTGMGKTTLLHRLIASDIAAGQGVGLIDPHGDFAESVLASVPPSRTNDIVLFDVGDTAFPLAFNVLACPDPAQRPLVASGVLSAFKKLYGDSWGPRLEHILRNALLTLIEVPGTSLVSVLRILSDPRYRRSVLTRVKDPVVRAFWEHEFAAMPPKFQAEAIAPIQNKVGHFVSSPLLRNILGQAKSTLDLRQILDDGKVLIVNLSKGRIGDDASTLLGSLLVTSLQLAAMSRADVAESDRRDFALYVDEFQNFATDSFATILSEARKYRLSLTLANQYLAQMDEATLAAVFGNIGTLIVFQIGAQDAETIAEQLGGDVQKEDLLQLPRYAAYIRLLIEGMPSRPFSMRTLAPPASGGDPERSQIIRRVSRRRYARPRVQVDSEIAAALGSH